jgi:hypothetical protein
MKTRICNQCKTEKPVEDFTYTQKSSTGKLYNLTRTKCLKCRYERQKERLRERFGSDGIRHYVDRRRIFRRYGVTFEEVEKTLQSQNNKCKICELPIQFFTKTYNNRACVDHCHTTNKIRGILCHYCNTGIGYLKDSPTVLQRAIDYLS